jgi:FG-GAP-like repeat/FG-GAP repeat
MKFMMALTLLALGVSAAPDPQPAMSFREVSISVGKGPKCIALADVNHDGKVDLLVGNADDSTLSVLLGDGRGNFRQSSGSPFPAGHYPNDMVVGDMNSDGNLDLVIANHQSPYITILLGNGKGGFRPAPNSPYDVHSEPHPHGVALGDFNGDGKLDVVTDSWGTNQIELLLGKGNGEIDPRAHYFQVGRRPYERLRSADFNKDGHPDVVTTDLDADASTVLLGDSSGGFHEAVGSPFPSGAKPWEVAVDDINKDGNPDLVIIPYERDVKDASEVAMTVLLGDGRGGFRPMTGSPLPLADCHGPNSVATGDINGDGVRDIVVSCAQNRNILFFLGSRDGTFVVHTRRSQGGWGAIAVGDLNEDDKDDVVVANNEDNTVTVLLSR